MKREIVACVALIGAVVALDRFSKLWFMRLPTEGPFSLLGNFVALTKHYNLGLIGDLPMPPVVIFAIAAIVLALVVAGLYRSLASDDLPRSLAFSLITAGAIGNLWDRIAWGFVFDWLLLFNRSVINAADVAIAAGLIGYLMTHRRSIHSRLG